MKYIVTAVAKEEKKARNGDLYRGVQVDGNWVNVMLCPPDLKKGETIWLTEPKTLGRGTNLWAYIADPETEEEPKKITEEKPAEVEKGKEEPLDNPAKFRTDGIKTVSGWEKFVRRVHQVAKSLEPEEGLARTALVNTAVIAWAENKLVLDDLEEVPF